MKQLCFAALISVVLSAGCAPAAPSQPVAPGGQPAGPPPREKVLNISINYEPNFIAALSPIDPRGATDHFLRLFNAQLDMHDGNRQGRPYLAEALPALNTDSWTVFPDGRMETRYRLRPNLVWHDGQPLTTADFLFAFQMATPANGFQTSVAPYSFISEIVAPDDRSLVVRWKNLYPDAGVLVGANRFGLVPLPRHILQQVSTQGIEAIQTHPYWLSEFVSAGPFKLVRWDQGSRFEAVAFDQHALGRPKIDRLVIEFITDPNTAFANMLAGSTDVGLLSITFPQMLQLQKEWRGGTAGYTVAAFGAAYFQHKPEYLKPAVGGDIRVRRALHHALDRQAIADTIGEGKLKVWDTIFDPDAEYYPQIDRVITKYPTDLRASERLMGEASLFKGPDGVWNSPTEGRLSFGIFASATRLEVEPMASQWRQAGFEIDWTRSPIRPELGSDTTVPFMYNNSYTAHETAQMERYKGTVIATAANRFTGENITGWANQEYDRLLASFQTTLDANERIRQRVQMAKIMSDELPAIQLLTTANPHAVSAKVKNVPDTTRTGTMGRITWNIHEWDIE